MKVIIHNHYIPSAYLNPSNSTHVQSQVGWWWDTQEGFVVERCFSSTRVLINSHPAWMRWFIFKSIFPCRNKVLQHRRTNKLQRQKNLPPLRADLICKLTFPGEDDYWYTWDVPSVAVYWGGKNKGEKFKAFFGQLPGTSSVASQKTLVSCLVSLDRIFSLGQLFIFWQMEQIHC